MSDGKHAPQQRVPEVECQHSKISSSFTSSEPLFSQSSPSTEGVLPTSVNPSVYGVYDGVWWWVTALWAGRSSADSLSDYDAKADPSKSIFWGRAWNVTIMPR